jgi:dihydrofolate reductase
MSAILVSLVCALTRQQVIGVNNQLPWHLPADLAHFKAITLGHPIIMGRKTYDSIGRPLPGRANLVVTTQPNWQVPGVMATPSLPDALHQAKVIAAKEGKQEVMLIGGASLYREALPLVDKMYLTWVEAEVPGDAYFPPVDWSLWQVAQRETRAADEKNNYDLEFVTYLRRAIC